jgi:hypothetical protein
MLVYMANLQLSSLNLTETKQIILPSAFVGEMLVSLMRVLVAISSAAK